MKINLNKNLNTGGSVIAPVNPPIPVDINDLLELQVFGTTSSAEQDPISDNTITRPFAKITIHWKIVAKTDTVKLQDYTFQIVAPPKLKLSNIAAQGTDDFILTRTTKIWLQASRNGSSFVTVGNKIDVVADTSACTPIDVLTNVLEQEVFNAMQNYIASSDGKIDYRTTSVPNTPGNNQGGFTTVQSQPFSELTSSSMKFYFPLEIIIPNFFDADFDLNLELQFILTHFDDHVEVDARVTFDFDISFSTLEHIFGQVVASPHAIEKTIEKMLPLLLDCLSSDIERQALQLIFENTPGLAEAINEGHLQNVIFYPGSYVVSFIFCTPPPVLSGNDPVVVRG